MRCEGRATRRSARRRLDQNAECPRIHFGDLLDWLVFSVPSNIIYEGGPARGPGCKLVDQPLSSVYHAGPVREDPDAIIPAERVRWPILLEFGEPTGNGPFLRVSAFAVFRRAQHIRIYRSPAPAQTASARPIRRFGNPERQAREVWPAVVDFSREGPILRRERTLRFRRTSRLRCTGGAARSGLRPKSSLSAHRSEPSLQWSLEHDSPAKPTLQVPRAEERLEKLCAERSADVEPALRPI